MAPLAPARTVAAASTCAVRSMVVDIGQVDDDVLVVAAKVVVERVRTSHALRTSKSPLKHERGPSSGPPYRTPDCLR